MKRKKKSYHPLKEIKIRKPGKFDTLLPKTHRHRAFYIRVDKNTWFRIYKVKHLFSTVGVSWIMEFYISYRDLKRLKNYPLRSSNYTIGINDCPPKEGEEIIDSLKKHGQCDLRNFFEVDEETQNIIKRS